MQLEVVISANEVLNFQSDYRKHIITFPLARKSEVTWVMEQVINRLSAATSQRGEWAVRDTLKRAVARALSQFDLCDEPAYVLREAELACRMQEQSRNSVQSRFAAPPTNELPHTMAA